jgi:hypothetical protein
MSNDSDDSQDKDKNGKLITFPGGKKLDPSDLGADYIISQTGDVPTPDVVDPVSVDKDVRERIEYVKNQELVKAIGRKASTSELIDVLLREISEEISHLKFERRKATRDGKNTSNYTIGRINSLKNMADLLLKRKESMLAEQLDLKSPRMQAVFKVWMEFFYYSMEKAGIENKIIDLVFHQMKANMADWEKKMISASNM